MEVRDKHAYLRAIGIIASVCVVLQMALSPQLSVFGGTINFMMILTGCVALLTGSRYGVFAGFFSGVLYDFTMPVPAGLMMLMLSVAGYVLGSGERNRLQEQLDASVKLFAGVCLGVNVAYSIALVLTGAESSIVSAVLGHGLASTVLDTIFVVPFLYALSRTDFGQAFSTRIARKGYRKLR